MGCAAIFAHVYDNFSFFILHYFCAHAQKFARMAFGALFQFARRAFEHDPSARRARLGAKVHNPVGAFDDVHVVLDDDDRVSALDQGVERREQFRDCLLYTSPSPRDA